MDEMAQEKLEYIGVDLVLPPVEGEEQGQIVEWGVRMCQKGNDTVIKYVIGFTKHIPVVSELLRQPVRWLKG